ncbi:MULTISPECIES: heme biosynthesis HemY N-terminal domain-containing protein [unclassified Neisseria]|uniref:heme biosynthesis HemY N-terminal domain-containing protein n=1 Tax=unclassified Neisseria TaxID=2623750 RepID=UPI002666A3CE|nr:MULTISPECIES: heme biosynthesis HemY N-terminal domain-containing protein [unclassified Neisseria]MDO1510455.1 heme biosynthesis HemY N-terminal domain-containing protein [Neisseria sp. MVDL19-042950]MDO1516624.1 heme biosynthesis HemY N-terminal domain-containing protein [Neisseria sp. MVDL18-041461]MDO1563770.1 heme biosynthesis HemY N-terminal domain-containing protein [Neisseria sp. MVDL20-010259]
MRGLVWVIILFAVAVGLAIAAGTYTGNVYVVVEQTILRINLHAFILGLIALVVVLYLLVRLIAGILNVPGRMQRFGVARKGRQAAAALNNAGLAFFEGKFQKAEQEAAKVLANKEAGDNRTLALMLGAHAADQMDNIGLRDRYLKDIEALPAKKQLSRYLLLAESALSRRDYPAAEQNLISATQINPSLTRLVRLQLRYAFDKGNALEVLDKADKLVKAGAISDYEAEQYQNWAYHRLLALASDHNGLKVCLKRIPEYLKTGELCIAIAEKYERLGLYGHAVKWVEKYYPHTQQAELLKTFVQSVRFLNDKEQRKAIDLADGWLQGHPNNAKLLMYLGELAYGKQLWGKAQTYLEASLAIDPSMPARLALAKVFDETEQPEKAEQQRKLALESVSADDESL